MQLTTGEAYKLRRGLYMYTVDAGTGTSSLAVTDEAGGAITIPDTNVSADTAVAVYLGQDDGNNVTITPTITGDAVANLSLIEPY